MATKRTRSESTPAADPLSGHIETIKNHIAFVDHLDKRDRVRIAETLQRIISEQRAFQEWTSDMVVYTNSLLPKFDSNGHGMLGQLVDDMNQMIEAAHTATQRFNKIYTEWLDVRTEVIASQARAAEKYKLLDTTEWDELLVEENGSTLVQLRVELGCFKARLTILKNYLDKNLDYLAELARNASV